MAMGTMISDEQDTFELLVRVEAGLYMEREESSGGCDMVTREEWGGSWRAKTNKRELKLHVWLCYKLPFLKKRAKAKAKSSMFFG